MTLNNQASHFNQVIEIINSTRENVTRTVNTELISMYWNIGQFIVERIEAESWGKSVVESLSIHIKSSVPGSKGFSAQNLWRMKQFYEEYRDAPNLSPLVREINWTNNLIIFSRIKSEEEREHYLRRCIGEGLSKRQLERLIDTDSYKLIKRQKLSLGVREMRQKPIHEHFKDKYFFDFIDIPEKHTEKDIRKGLIKEIGKFLTEMGRDFLFVGEEFRIQVGSSDFFIDLLLYHRELRCLVAIELKTTKFKPQHIGQLNFYLEALDRDVKKTNENPSVGLLLCKYKDEEVVEYALSKSLSQALVAEYKTKMPSLNVLESQAKQLFDKYERLLDENSSTTEDL